ncbi:DHH family phosphoesterase [Halorhabdus sp. SVX81]|uniref:DHH family phosphoesterase n=1 Tax=Halorhabdus sp. SVX81 TaxID=2978283 RepID=UPI0023DA58C7|nr:bifunctional oligoribonuclease/PAP phosphatase NrnA [Halorhabdus sp. SVX81]WEL17896.1 DHH family phosphoesterase [Halorhabdus sp. SVX81]
MRTRLVVGTGSIARAVTDALCDRPGRLLVAGPDEETNRLCESGAAEWLPVDPTDPAALGKIDAPVETVVVAGATPVGNLAMARHARQAFPSAFLLAYTGTDGHHDDNEQRHSARVGLQSVADRVVDPGDVLGSYLQDRVETGGLSVHKLREVIANVDGTLAVVMHDNPDPDAIASAIALVRIAERMGCPAEACYYGSINHQQNRAFVNLLDIDLTALETDADLSAFGGFALVDHARPGVNDGLPEDTAVDIVIDHHPPRGPVRAAFTDLRSDVGATSTLLVEYIRRLDIDISETVATALLFGIRVDTNEFTREVSAADFEAGAFLLQAADLGVLERIEDPSMSSDTFETIADAIHNRSRHGSVLLSGVGEIRDRDTLAQAADRLLAMEDVTTTLVYGIQSGTIYISARSRGTDLDLGETLRAAFGQIGSAGGHADMAGAQLDLGVMEAISDDTDLAAIVEEIVTDRFLDALEIFPSQLPPESYGIETELPGNATPTTPRPEADHGDDSGEDTANRYLVGDDESSTEEEPGAGRDTDSGT